MASAFDFASQSALVLGTGPGLATRPHAAEFVYITRQYIYLLVIDFDFIDTKLAHAFRGAETPIRTI